MAGACPRGSDRPGGPAGNLGPVTSRVRFAPSPTGFLHVGSARTALFNWLHARSVGGTFVLRIEDTDAERNRSDLTDSLLAELEWLGLDWDEGPYFQSERRDRHREVVEDLLGRGLAYLCDTENSEVPGSVLADGLAVRFRMPEGGTMAFEDIVRGEVSFATDDLEDFVIWRSNGSPMFLLANAVDDADMGITHAIRGEDLLSGVPKVLLLLDAMGVPRPTYAHLPLLVNEQRKKLSKRRDDVSIGDYRERGYLPEAMVNYMALLGWGPPDDVEIRPLDEIVDLFRIQDVNKAAAFFDLKKLEHVNATHLRALDRADFIDRVAPWVGDDAPWPSERFDAIHAAINSNDYSNDNVVFIICQVIIKPRIFTNIGCQQFDISRGNIKVDHSKYLNLYNRFYLIRGSCCGNDFVLD